MTCFGCVTQAYTNTWPQQQRKSNGSMRRLASGFEPTPVLLQGEEHPSPSSDFPTLGVAVDYLHGLLRASSAVWQSECPLLAAYTQFSCVMQFKVVVRVSTNPIGWAELCAIGRSRAGFGVARAGWSDVVGPCACVSDCFLCVRVSNGSGRKQAK